MNIGLRLSLNDNLIILIATFLVETGATRSATELIQELQNSFEELNNVAKKFVNTSFDSSRKKAERETPQSRLFEDISPLRYLSEVELSS